MSSSSLCLQVKERYDSVAKMFKLLMTNEQLEAQCVASGDDTSSVSTSLIQCNLKIALDLGAGSTCMYSTF